MPVEFDPTYSSGERLPPGRLTKLVVPLITPYEKLNGYTVLDKESLIKSTQLAIRSGANILFVGGNAGDGRHLGIADYENLVKKVISTRDNLDKNVPVVAGILRPAIAEQLLFAKTAADLGANALVVAPLYGEGEPLFKIKTILDTTDRPIILYDNPSFTDNQSLGVKLVREAIEMGQGRVIGIKVSSKEPAVFLEMMTLRNSTFKVLQGTTALTAMAIKKEADGIVPVEANLNAVPFATLFEEKNNNEALRLALDDISNIIKNIAKEKELSKKNTVSAIRGLLVKKGVFKTSLNHLGK